MLEGVLLGSADGGWLAKIYWLNTLGFVSALWYAGKLYSSLSLVWMAMVVFQVVRLSEFSARVRQVAWAPGSRSTAPTAQAVA
mmetsp:Transcript_74683/g.198194  ORF Transcript_74683/g.198194 Transcript_74683/m.198194 type:complete len:83 (-) Transcript_74683:18-266(-)